MTILSYPNTRLRRNRKSQWSRSLIAESSFSINDLILPIFVQEGHNKEDEIVSMPDIYRYSTDLALKQIEKAKSLGINAVILFPYNSKELRTEDGREAYNENNLLCSLIKEIKSNVRDIGVIADVALDPYTSHGQDGVIDDEGNVLNDETIDALCKQALVLASAGCDCVAPSDMMDGRVGRIRAELERHNLTNVQIMSYAAKYASNFYGPFRDAVGSKNLLGKANKKTYQMDYRNIKEAMTEISLDIVEGADSIIIKPGMPYLDVIHAAANKFDFPIVAYQVSGEYSMLKYGAKMGIFEKQSILEESLVAFKRAGASSIITYAALELATRLNK